MSSECSICERDTRGPHDEDCPYYRRPGTCALCGGEVGEEHQCEDCGEYLSSDQILPGDRA